MRSTEELTALKAEVETLNKKLAELTEEELAQVVGGHFTPFRENPRVIESVLRWDTFDIYQKEKSL